MSFHTLAAHKLLESAFRVEGLWTSTRGNPFEWVFVASFAERFRGNTLRDVATTFGLDPAVVPGWCDDVVFPAHDVAIATLTELGYATVDGFFENIHSQPHVVLRTPNSLGPGVITRIALFQPNLKLSMTAYCADGVWGLWSSSRRPGTRTLTLVVFGMKCYSSHVPEKVVDAVISCSLCRSKTLCSRRLVWPGCGQATCSASRRSPLPSLTSPSGASTTPLCLLLSEREGYCV